MAFVKKKIFMDKHMIGDTTCFPNTIYLYKILYFLEYRFDGRAIEKLKSPGRLIPITSPVTSKFSTPAILRRSRKRRKHVSILYCPFSERRLRGWK